MTKTAVIYARYSSDAQSEQSIDGQLRVCEEYAKKNNILILNTYIDRAMTGTNDNRPDFQKMIKDSAQRNFQFVLVYKLDRFSRNKYETAIHKNTLKQNGVKVLSAMENIPDTPEGIILESLLEGMNAYYSAELAQKVSRGMKETRRKGLYQGGTVLYGYKIDGRKIVINESEAEIVRYIYQRYSQGAFVKDIIKELHGTGVYYKGRPFIKNSVYNILRNEKYSGVYKHGDEVIDNMYPKIVPDELFEKVRQIVNNNKLGRNCVKVDFMLKGKLRCGYCGHTLNGESGTKKDGSRMYYYKCSGRKKQLTDCKKSMVRKEILEQLVLDNIYSLLNSAEEIDYAVQQLLKIQENSIKANSVLNILFKEQKSVETAINNIVANMERGIVAKATSQRLCELEERQAELEKQILIEQSKTVITLSEEQIRNFFKHCLELEPQALINFYIKEILLYDDKMEIIYNNPLTVSPDYENGRGFSFYSKSADMLAYLYCNTQPQVNKIRVDMYI